MLQLDLRSTLCPMNFVRARLLLETMEVGECAEILVSMGEAAENVPMGLKELGHRICSREEKEDYVAMVVERR